MNYSTSTLLDSNILLLQKAKEVCLSKISSVQMLMISFLYLAQRFRIYIRRCTTLNHLKIAKTTMTKSLLAAPTLEQTIEQQLNRIRKRSKKSYFFIVKNRICHKFRKVQYNKKPYRSHIKSSKMRFNYNPVYKQ